jgi:predicted nucleic-acid-binding Zn-ribbon protein
MDISREAPACPECGGARYWYGSVEFWVGGSTHSSTDNLQAAVCGDCGYSSLYLENVPDFRRALAAKGADTPAGDPQQAPGMLAAAPPDRAEIRAFRKATRRQRKSGDI